MRQTVRDLCIAALKTAGAIGIKDTPDKDEIVDALDTLNTLLESLAVSREVIFNTKQVTTNSDNNGFITFGSGTENINDAIIKIDAIIDINGRVALQELNKNQFDLMFSNENYGLYYSVDYSTTFNGKIRLAPNTQVSIRYRPYFLNLNLNDIFSDILPLFNWGMLENGLAALLGPKYGLDNTFNMNVFQSRKDSIANVVDVSSLILNERRQSGSFNNGWL